MLSPFPFLNSLMSHTVVPEGSYINTCNKTDGDDCLPFIACKAGFIGEVPPSLNCIQCEAGKASTSGAISCIACEAGKIAPVVSSPNCTACNKNNKEYSDTIGLTKCEVCKANEISTGTQCILAPFDSDLPVPKDVTIRRTNNSDFHRLNIRWTTDDDDDAQQKFDSFIVSISSSADFDANVTEVKATTNEVTFTSMDDVRKTVLYAKVQSVGGGVAQRSAPSAVSKEWISKNGKSCLLQSQFLNCSSLVPAKWECGMCPLGGSCIGSVTWQEIGPVSVIMCWFCGIVLCVYPFRYLFICSTEELIVLLIHLQLFGWWKIPQNERQQAAKKDECHK